MAFEVVLNQNHHPIAFFSKKKKYRMQNQVVYTREFYAISKVIAKFRYYLIGHKFIIQSDQLSLKILVDQVIQTLEQQIGFTNCQDMISQLNINLAKRT